MASSATCAQAAPLGPGAWFFDGPLSNLTFSKTCRLRVTRPSRRTKSSALSTVNPRLATSCCWVCFVRFSQGIPDVDTADEAMCVRAPAHEKLPFHRQPLGNVCQRHSPARWHNVPTPRSGKPQTPAGKRPARRAPPNARLKKAVVLSRQKAWQRLLPKHCVKTPQRAQRSSSATGRSARSARPSKRCWRPSRAAAQSLRRRSPPMTPRWWADGALRSRFRWWACRRSCCTPAR